MNNEQLEVGMKKLWAEGSYQTSLNVVRTAIRLEALEVSKAARILQEHYPDKSIDELTGEIIVGKEL